MKKIALESGQLFNCWKVLKLAEDMKVYYCKAKRIAYQQWEVECTNCGNIKKATHPDLVDIVRNSRVCINCYLLPKGHSGLTQFLCAYKVRAKKKGLEFKLTREEFHSLTSSNCHYCGAVPAMVYRADGWRKSKKYNNASAWGDYCCNGVDRVDNRKGYDLSNCVSACAFCNRAKGAMPYDEFITRLDKIAMYRTTVPL